MDNLRIGSEAITFRNGIIEGFEPNYRSIDKDGDRYFDALFNLSEKGLIEASDVIQLSGQGKLWISYQYIDKGLLDLVEANLLRTVSSRDFLGPLFENTCLVLERLLEESETDRVMTIYRAAIRHRLKAMKSEVALWQKTRKKHPNNGSSKWIRHHMPPLKKMMKDYRALLAGIGRSDEELAEFEQALKALEI